MVALFKALQTPKMACVAFLMIAIPAVFYSAHTVNLYKLDEQTQKNSHTLLQDIGQRIGVLNTVLGSMAALQVVSDEFDNNKLQRFSYYVLRNTPYIHNIGSFEAVDEQFRNQFESRMIQKGYSDFGIAQLEDNGSFKNRQDNHTYYPISVAGPQRASVPGLIGLDLGTLPDFEQLLANASSSMSATMITLPDAWPLQGDAMMFKPSYTGGYWLTVDLETMFSTFLDNSHHFDVTLEVIDAKQRSILFSATGSRNSSLLLTDIYDRRTTLNSWPISQSTRLAITLKEPIGMSPLILGIAVITAVLISLLSCLYTAHFISRKQNEHERSEGLKTLSKERRKAENTLNSVPDAIITLDAQMFVVQINPAALIQFNTRPGLAIGKSIHSLASFKRANSTDQVVDLACELSVLSNAEKKEIDVVPMGQNDNDFTLKMSLTRVVDHDNKVSGYVVVLRDVSRERRLTKRLAYQANYDALTGCTNRYFFEHSLEQLIDEMYRSNQTHTLCYIDLDQFKVINDTCGHRAGDQLLIELTKNIQLLIRDQDTFSRLGGDEFGVILVGVNQQEAMIVTQRIYESFQNFIFSHQGNTFSVTASIGVVHIDSPDATSKDVMASADIACYAAKDSGRNSMSVFSKNDRKMTERSEELSWLPRLQTALNNDEFRLYVQAVASLENSHNNHPTRHFEFLLRLTDKDGTDMTPWQFIQAAERYDLMREIDRWVISNALKRVSECSQSAARDCSFSINLSGQSAADPTLKMFIQQQIELHKVDASKVWFELTETAAISHFSVAVDLIKSIRKTGAKVALDDFGSGLSSFGYLKNLPIDVIKIDGQFIKEIVNNPIDREMVRAIHRVGQSMNIETVAEFVENQAIVDELVRIGVNYAQGYHIGKPMLLQDALMLLDKETKAA